MISIQRSGTALVVNVSIPPHLNDGKVEHYIARVDLGGSEPAVAALVECLRDKMGELVTQIRREAYEQGARDRSRKATQFSGNLWSIKYKGGCYQ